MSTADITQKELGPEYLRIMLDCVSDVRKRGMIRAQALLDAGDSSKDDPEINEITSELDRYAERCIERMRALNITSPFGTIMRNACHIVEQLESFYFIQQWGLMRVLSQLETICKLARVYAETLDNRMQVYAMFVGMDLDQMTAGEVASALARQDMSDVAARADLSIAISKLRASVPSFLGSELAALLEGFRSLPQSWHVANKFIQDIERASSNWTSRLIKQVYQS